MRLSFDDEESFKEAAAGGSLRFYNPPSDSDTLALQQMGSGCSVPVEDMNENICFNNPPSDSISTPQVGSDSEFEVTKRY